MRKEPTVAERLLWERLRGHRLNAWGFRRQAPLGQFVIDFLCHDPPVAVEVDGPLHREPARAASDAERDRIVTALGYVVVRIDEALVRGESRLPEEMITAAGMNARAAK